MATRYYADTVLRLGSLTCDGPCRALLPQDGGCQRWLSCGDGVAVQPQYHSAAAYPCDAGQPERERVPQQPGDTARRSYAPVLTSGCRWAAPVVWWTSCRSERSATRFAAATRNGVLRSRYDDGQPSRAIGLVCALFAARRTGACSTILVTLERGRPAMLRARGSGRGICLSLVSTSMEPKN